MKILIIDIETTCFLKGGGKIAEIGVVELNLNNGEKKIVFDKIINPKISREELEKTWIVSNEYMKVEEIEAGVSFENIKAELQDIINSYSNGSTAFNRRFDIDFLESYGITFRKKLPCPMLLSTDICKIQGKYRYKRYKWPKVEEAYKFFFPESDYTELHRGADDAFHEADIVYALYKRGAFDINCIS